ncbi:sodium:proton antiporter [Teredinibacter sp. KSP-S5-2]|uniref:cation:proton antiporter n=1 Tax=Teredinibacter sp. KSP-S5-2 TaxID=3034506 RepID=UPI0029346EFF|nr:sodium:proton antiporter [Teredinibacter sp. KSP-S5-2]WNO07814.1 sodium:proton antiporter [Teredinibacter sp. KSP-S5-2]
MSTLVTLGMVAILGFACQWLAWKTTKPAILYLLMTGILIGPVSGLLDTDALLGELLFPLVSLSVAVILFEGSLTLKRSELKDISGTVLNMVTYGALLNVVIVTLATHYLAGLDWPLAALFGSLMVVTGPTVIVPILRTLRPNEKISRTLRWEGIVIDPLGALFAVIVFEWIIVQGSSTEITAVIGVFLKTLATGLGLGVTLGYAYGLLLRHHLLPEYLHNFSAIATVVAGFVLSDTLSHESGLLTITVMGIWLANMPGVDTRGILEFKESLTLIFVSSLFILLAARIDFAAFRNLGYGALGVLLVMQCIARPAKILLSTLGSSFTWRERTLLAWVGPRGIVAAAVTALFALRLDQLGYAQASLLVPLAFSVIIGTVVIQSMTARSLAKWLDVCEDESAGYLVIGANPVAIGIASALQGAGIKVVLCDNYWENIKAARMAGLSTYYGSPVSDHADLHLDTTGLHGMLGLSHQAERNTSAALRFREEFDLGDIYTLAMPGDREKFRTSEQHGGKFLFESSISYGKLASLFSKGAEVRKTRLTESFVYSDWQKQNQSSSTIELFALDPDNKIHWFTSDNKPQLNAGWIIYALNLQTKTEGELAKNQTTLVENVETAK